MDPKQLEQTINEWWKFTETERLLLGNDRELIQELTGRNYPFVVNITHFKIVGYMELNHTYSLSIHTTRGSTLPRSVRFLDLRLQSLQEGYRGTGSETA